jgi:hypothetical protein
MKSPSPPACRRVRAALQALADSHPLPQRFQAHLARCPSCRRFQDFLSAYPRALQEGLDARLRGWAPADLQEILCASSTGPAAQAAESEGTRRGRRRIWVSAAAAALLVAGWGGLRLYDARRTARDVRAELSAAVDRLYSAPLVDGVESALVHPQPDVGRLLEGLSPESGLEGLGAGEFPN